MSFFAIDPQDNVATALCDCAVGEHEILGESELKSIPCNETIRAGHKVALKAISSDQPVLKYGVCIGNTTAQIRPGDWVHLHNMRSNFDERSTTLDLKTGVSTDIAYE